MNKKRYITPATEVMPVMVENMLAASIGVDHTPGDMLEGNSLNEGENSWNIWEE